MDIIEVGVAFMAEDAVIRVTRVDQFIPGEGSGTSKARAADDSKGIYDTLRASLPALTFIQLRELFRRW